MVLERHRLLKEEVCGLYYVKKQRDERGGNDQSDKALSSWHWVHGIESNLLLTFESKLHLAHPGIPDNQKMFFNFGDVVKCEMSKR